MKQNMKRQIQILQSLNQSHAHADVKRLQSDPILLCSCGYRLRDLLLLTTLVILIVLVFQTEQHIESLPTQTI